MRFLVPLALLSATATTVLAETAQDLIQDSLPQCLQSCVGNVFENISGCDLSDTDCLCSAGTPSSDTLSTAKSDLTTCITSANCTAAETQEIAKLDYSSLMDEANSLCSGAAAVSANVVLAAGAMAFALFL
ncbi:CFEM domain-containing protein [Aspergillus mulundensis]|uniref:CFEM domain-containing protein n=1 Tax=Aspergillus mulundensis TaxID=1810919 RepID=A0A3D8R0D2_9EURO|nr:Uncharacterized protein DSM5745_09246 [Aspergillus mulundensis]RDW67380.1 Uncharacterized protein DSM5745_09246 [Aspergillus mulundensis]